MDGWMEALLSIYLSIYLDATYFVWVIISYTISPQHLLR